MGKYRDTRKHCWPLSRTCEHCDGEKSPFVRSDNTRGLVCPVCDDALDAMESEMATPGDSYCEDDRP